MDGGFTSDISNGSWDQPWKTLTDALSNVPSGNQTIIVRGAHDSFNGIYKGYYNLSAKTGVFNKAKFS